MGEGRTGSCDAPTEEQTKKAEVLSEEEGAAAVTTTTLYRCADAAQKMTGKAITCKRTPVSPDCMRGTHAHRERERTTTGRKCGKDEDEEYCDAKQLKQFT